MLKIEIELAACCKKLEIPGQCFVGHEKFDVLWRGKKIAGAAQRRNKLGLLIQGSVQPPPVSVARGDWENALTGRAKDFIGGGAEIFSLPPAVATRAEVLARTKYSQTSHNEKR